MVEVICYGKLERWATRKAAKEEFQLAAAMCDGSEADRYMKIYSQLCSGVNLCVDSEYTAEQVERCRARYDYVHSKDFDNYMVIPNRSVCNEKWGGYFGIWDEYGNEWTLQVKTLDKANGNLMCILRNISDYTKVRSYEAHFWVNVQTTIRLFYVTQTRRTKENDSITKEVTKESELLKYKAICKSAVERIGYEYLCQSINGGK